MTYSNEQKKALEKALGQHQLLLTRIQTNIVLRRDEENLNGVHDFNYVQGILDLAKNSIDSMIHDFVDLARLNYNQQNNPFVYYRSLQDVLPGLVGLVYISEIVNDSICVTMDQSKAMQFAAHEQPNVDSGWTKHVIH